MFNYSTAEYTNDIYSYLYQFKIDYFNFPLPYYRN